MNVPAVVVTVLWTWAPILFTGAVTGWALGLRVGWKAKKFVDLRIQRKAGGIRTPDQYEVIVDERKYLVNCVEEIPERDRELVRSKSISTINWELHFLRKNPKDLLAECRACKKKYYPHENHDFKNCAGFVKVIPIGTNGWQASDGESDTLDEFPIPQYLHKSTPTFVNDLFKPKLRLVHGSGKTVKK